MKWREKTLMIRLKLQIKEMQGALHYESWCVSWWHFLLPFHVSKVSRLNSAKMWLFQCWPNQWQEFPNLFGNIHFLQLHSTTTRGAEIAHSFNGYKTKNKPHDIENGLLLLDKTDLFCFPLEAVTKPNIFSKSISVLENPSVSKRGEDSRHFHTLCTAHLTKTNNNTHYFKTR